MDMDDISCTYFKGDDDADECLSDDKITCEDYAAAVDRRVKMIQARAKTDGRYESPINLTLRTMERIELPPLGWYNYDLAPRKARLTNTGQTVILSGKWNEERPFLGEGPLIGSYVFSQLHFHWGETDRDGSEHLADNRALPFEMHAVHFKSIYMRQESALQEIDGVCVLVYLFVLQQNPNPHFEPFINVLPAIRKPHTSASLEPEPLCGILREFDCDYFLYWGSVLTEGSSPTILWFVCREPLGISSQQLARFRTVLNRNKEPLLRNHRPPRGPENRKVFHVSPSQDLNGALLPPAHLDRPSISQPGPGHQAKRPPGGQRPPPGRGPYRNDQVRSASGDTWKGGKK